MQCRPAEVGMGKPMSVKVSQIGAIRRGGDKSMEYAMGTHLCDWPLLLLLLLLLQVSLCKAAAALASPRQSKPAHFHVSLPPGNLPAVCHLMLGLHHILRPLRPHILCPEAHVRLPAELASFAAPLGHAFIVHLHAARTRSHQSSTSSLQSVGSVGCHAFDSKVWWEQQKEMGGSAYGHTWGCDKTFAQWAVAGR
jgi:hypothetical protein